MKLEKTNIKAKYPVSIYDLGYTPNPPSDEDIYIYWALKLKGIRSKTMTTYKLDESSNLVEIGKRDNYPLMNDKDEFIPRKYWQDLQSLQGENVAGCYSPCWGLTRSIIQGYFIKHSDTLIIQTCGNKKPYIDNVIFNIGKKLMFGGIADFCVCSTETLPIVFSEYYPFRYYDWAHVMEDEFTKDILQQFQFDRIVNFVNYFGYKKVIFIKPLKNYITYELEPLVKRLIEFYKHVDNVEFINLIDEDSVKRAEERFDLKQPKMRGILKSRYINLHSYQLYEILGLDENQKIKQIYTKDDFIKQENSNLNNDIIVPNYIIPTDIHSLINSHKNATNIIENKIDENVENNKSTDVVIDEEGSININRNMKSDIRETVQIIYDVMDDQQLYKKELKQLINETSQKNWSDVYLTKVIDSCTLNYKKEKPLKSYKNYFIYDETTQKYTKNKEI